MMIFFIGCFELMIIR